MSKPKIILLSIFALTFIGACGKSGSSKKPVTDQDENANREKWSYALEGKDDGKTCTTGAKTFSTLHDMCLTLQDPAKNNENCALNERIERFAKDCEPAGYTFLESFQCEVLLVKKDVKIDSPFQKIKATDLLASHHFCMGWKEGNIKEKLDSLTLKFDFYEGIMLDIDAKFVPERDVTEESFSYFKLNLIDKDGVALIKEPYEFSGIMSLNSGPTEDFKYQYKIDCGLTPSCPRIK